MASTVSVAASQHTALINRRLSSLSHSRRLLQSQPSVPFLPSRSRASVIAPPSAIAAPRASLAAVPPPHPRVSLFSKTSASPLLPSREPLPSRRPADSVRASAAAGAAAFGDGARAFDDTLPFPPPTRQYPAFANANASASAVPGFRAILFYLVTLIIATPLFVIMLVLQPFVLLLDRTKRRAQHLINNVWANTTTAVFYPTEVVGVENLPPPDAPAVYVANHQSFLDIYTLFQLRRPFKFISKTSNFLIPIVGWSMFLTGHVPLKRMDKRSQMECLKKCLELLQQGTPVLFFPEGTRTKDGKLSDFKKGAFSIAAKAGVPVGGVVRVVVHPPITGTDADKLCEQSRAVIASTLRQHGLGVH
ncbi:unnamed protein product [Closterium sp. Yama58-4]|nr:unnamed protein product [Closterium sp. Yama58-4]